MNDESRGRRGGAERDRSEGGWRRWLRAVPWARVLFVGLAVAPVLLLGAEAVDRRWMDDDGFINLRIVRNWLEGHGPVYNVDERVEASTSPLWLLVIAALGRLGLGLEHAAAFAGIALTLVGLILAQEGALRLDGTTDKRGGRTWRLGYERALPIGAAIVAALPVQWDYASGGLENGLAVAWLGTTFWALAARLRAPAETGAGGARGTYAVAAVIGLGPLIRPEFVLYTAPMLASLGWAAWIDARARAVAPVGVLAAAGLCAAATPLAYEVFRMGYYAAIVPNTALAKEAFRGNWGQGVCYFWNFFGTYQLGWPLLAAAPFWVVGVRRAWSAGDRPALFLTVGLPAVGALHVLFLVAIGGDYMHGRLLLPAVFAGVLPVMMAPLPPLPPPRARAAWLICAGSIGAWAVVCAALLRVPVENQCGIGDERGWYARKAGSEHPVELEAYRSHPFYDSGLTTIQHLHDACPSLDQGRAGECRRMVIDEEKAHIAPAPTVVPLALSVDPRVDAVVSSGAIGIFGYLFPSDVHVVDMHGLAEPYAARLALESRGRPGHEKKLAAGWLFARFAAPSPGEDPSVTAARRALHCSTLPALEQAISGPLSGPAFVDNLAHAWRYSRMRIPSDPYDAEVKLCGATRAIVRATGGSGGTPSQWRCPAGMALSGLRGTLKPKDQALASVQPLCRASTAEGLAPVTLDGPVFGDATTDGAFEALCPAGGVVSGLFGTSDNLVRSVGVTCGSGRGAVHTSSGGYGRGQHFALDCAPLEKLVGVEIRAGTLLDSIGLACMP